MKRLFFRRIAIPMFFFWGGGLAQAQIPAASLFQTPLLIHPAMAGNTGKHRIALLANQNDYYLPVSKEPAPYHSVNEVMSARSVYDKATNFYGSYDQLWKGYGIGGFVTYSNTPKQTNSNASYRQEYGSFRPMSSVRGWRYHPN